MNRLCRFVNWALFVIRNQGQKPAYPFEDDCAEKPLELRIGPWGSTKWYDPSDGGAYDVITIDDTASIAESMERDIWGYTHQEAVEAEHCLKKESYDYSRGLPPRVIRFLKQPLGNTR